MKTHKTKKIQRAGLQPPVVYSHPDNDIHKQWFDLFMKNIVDVKLIGRGAFGVALAITSSLSPYKKNGKFVNKLLIKFFKMKYIKQFEKGLEEHFNKGDMTRDDVNEEIRKMGSFEKEVETQIEFYSATISKSINDCLCPKIVYDSSNYNLDENIDENIDVNNSTLTQIFKEEQVLYEGTTKIIAMEFMDSYQTLETVFLDADQEQKGLYLAMTMYTLIRFTYLTGKRQCDEHMGNIMIDKNVEYFPGKLGKAILIDFGSTEDMNPTDFNLFLLSYKEKNVGKLIDILINGKNCFRRSIRYLISGIKTNDSETKDSGEWKTLTPFQNWVNEVYELIDSRGEFEDNTRSKITDNETSKPDVDNETDEKCRKKCGWSFNKTKCLTKCKTKLKQVNEDMRLIDIATKNRRLCESNGYNCWSRRNFTPNQCKKKCAISLRNLNESTKIEPTLEYAKFIAHLYSKNPSFLCNKLFVQFIENSESINELIHLLNDTKNEDVASHGITIDEKKNFDRLLQTFKHSDYSENINVLKQYIEQAKLDMDCVNSVKPDMENLKDSTDLAEGLKNLNLGGFKSKKRKRKRKTKRFSNKK